MKETMPWWLGNPITLSTFVLISAIIALAIGNRHRGEIQFWRTVETVATLLGGVSLLLLSFNVEHFFASRYFDGFRQAYVGVRSHADFVPEYMCETKFEKLAESPKNFDDMVADKAILCEWSKNIK
ncbi:MAG TPA: hypothetical protein VGT81_08130, partial [Casimicrobiaceae bacterium]|nr:hypothetical protein [Casimicrobiaceae bacterium]